MKTIQLSPTDFYQFRKLAFTIALAFTCDIVKSVYFVQANIDQLESLGY